MTDANLDKTNEVKPLNLAGDQGMKATKTPSINGAKKQAMKKMTTMVLVLVLAGIASGYGLFRWKTPQKGKQISREVGEGEITKGTKVGVMDEEAFRDMAEGKLVSGGIDGEGSHHLEREGGESQNVYITSSIIDLDQFVDRQVKVWGETFEAQKAGWLMDVGRLEVLE